MPPEPAPAPAAGVPHRLLCRIVLAGAVAAVAGSLLARDVLWVRGGPFPLFYPRPLHGTRPVERADGALGADFARLYFRTPDGAPAAPAAFRILRALYAPVLLLDYAPALLVHVAAQPALLLVLAVGVLRRAGLRRDAGRTAACLLALVFFTPVGLAHVERGAFHLWTAAGLFLGLAFGFAGSRPAPRLSAAPGLWLLAFLPLGAGARSAAWQALPAASAALVAGWAFLRRDARRPGEALRDASFPLALAMAFQGLGGRDAADETGTVLLLALLPFFALWSEGTPRVDPGRKRRFAIGFAVLVLAAFRTHIPVDYLVSAELLPPPRLSLLLLLASLGFLVAALGIVRDPGAPAGQAPGGGGGGM